MQSLGVVLLEAIAVLGVFTTSVYLRLDFSNIQSKESFGNEDLKLNIPLKYFITDGC